MMIKVTLFKRDGRKHYEVQWVDPITGKKRTRTTGETIKRKAERFAGQLQIELESETDSIAIPWDEFRERYEDEVLSELAIKTARKRRGTMNLLEHYIKPASPMVLDNKQIAKFRSKLRSRDISNFTLKSHLSILRTILKWAFQHKMIESLPHIDMPKTSKGMKGRPITQEEFDRIIKAVPKIIKTETLDSWLWLLHGLWWSGLRLTEALNLHWIDDSLVSVDLESEYPVFRFQPEGQKNRKAELIPMAPEFAEMLQSIPMEKRRSYVFEPAPQDGKIIRLSEDRIGKLISQFGKEAGVKVSDKHGRVKFASAHDFRRSFGMRWSKRVSKDNLKIMMRHRSIATTEEFYLEEDVNEVAASVWHGFANISLTSDISNSSNPFQKNNKNLQ